ncbi:MAG: GNAT family N-acetyltransferase [Pseudomonadales bacterium]
MSEPVLLPAQIESQRLLIRPPVAADSRALNEATCASFAELQPFMDWAQEPPTLEQSQAFCETGSRELNAPGMRPLLMWRRSDGLLLGGVGLAGFDLSVPRFELGYWCRSDATGNGYVSEAVIAQCRYLFGTLAARRVELRMDERNVASYRVAERLGFTLEGTLRNDGVANDGSLRSTRVYALYALAGLKQLGPG